MCLIHFDSSVPDWLLLDGIVSHLKKQAGPASLAVQTQADFDKLVAGKDAIVVGELVEVAFSLLFFLFFSPLQPFMDLCTWVNIVNQCPYLLYHTLMLKLCECKCVSTVTLVIEPNVNTFVPFLFNKALPFHNWLVHQCLMCLSSKIPH